MAGLLAITAVLNLLACIRPFCDLYKRTVYGLISDALGVLTGWFPVALGELLMYLGAVMVLVGVLLLPAYLVLVSRCSAVRAMRADFPKAEGFKRTGKYAGSRKAEEFEETGKHAGSRKAEEFEETGKYAGSRKAEGSGQAGKALRHVVAYWKLLLFAAAVLLFIYTLNWVIPFRGSILKVPGAVERGYTLEEVGAVRDHIVNMLNAGALEVERDENGKVIYDRREMTEAVFRAMRELSGEYVLLSGYYPPMKTALCSDFLEWMDIGGYTYPYTMEITWNEYCHDLYYPFLLAHESSHHQGYYQENEANFIAFLACTTSEDPLLRYAGYNEIYYYLSNAYVETAYDILGKEGAKEDLKARPQVSELVRQDRRDAQNASQEKYEAANHPAQSLATTAADVADVGWSVQGDILQENSYDGVVKMVLQYYDALWSASP